MKYQVSFRALKHDIFKRENYMFIKLMLSDPTGTCTMIGRFGGLILKFKSSSFCLIERSRDIMNYGF